MWYILNDSLWKNCFAKNVLHFMKYTEVTTNELSVLCMDHHWYTVHKSDYEKRLFLWIPLTHSIVMWKVPPTRRRNRLGPEQYSLYLSLLGIPKLLKRKKAHWLATHIITFHHTTTRRRFWAALTSKQSTDSTGTIGKNADTAKFLVLGFPTSSNEIPSSRQHRLLLVLRLRSSIA